MRYAQIRDGKIVAILNWDGEEKHEYGELRGPLPESQVAVAEWVGKPATVLDELVEPKKSAAASAMPSLSEAAAPVGSVLGFQVAQPEASSKLKEDKAYDIQNDTTVPVPDEREGDWNVSTPKADKPMTAAELLAKAEGMPVFTLRAEAEKILGNDTPEKKGAIIAALQRRAKQDAAA